MAALTCTLLERFGSQVVLPGTGIVMNNAIGYFDPRPGRPNSLAPERRIDSSNMCPVIAVRDSQARFALGASGASHIVPAVAQIAALLLDYGMDLEQALHTPRIEATGSRRVQYDPRLAPEIVAALAGEFEPVAAGLEVAPKRYACPGAIARDPASGAVSGACDPSSPIAAARAE